VAAHPAQRAEKRVGLAQADGEPVERADEVQDQRVELGVGDAHPGVRGAQVRTGVDAGPAGGLADLFDQARLAARDVGPGEAAVDRLVARAVADEVIGDGDAGRLPAETLVERELRRRHADRALAAAGAAARDGERERHRGDPQEGTKGAAAGQGQRPCAAGRPRPLPSRRTTRPRRTRRSPDQLGVIRCIRFRPLSVLLPLLQQTPREKLMASCI
jgi:hypothetical protein